MTGVLRGLNRIFRLFCRHILLTFNEYGRALLRKAELEIGEEITYLLAAVAAKGTHPVAVLPCAEFQWETDFGCIEDGHADGLAGIEIVRAVKEFDLDKAPVKTVFSRSVHREFFIILDQQFQWTHYQRSACHHEAVRRAVEGFPADSAVGFEKSLNLTDDGAAERIFLKIKEECISPALAT